MRKMRMMAALTVVLLALGTVAAFAADDILGLW